MSTQPALDFTINLPTIIAGVTFAWTLFGKVKRIGTEIDKIPHLERRLRRIEFRLKIEPSLIEGDEIDVA